MAILTITGFKDGLLTGEQAMNLADELLAAGYTVALETKGGE